ncbi:MAG: CGNR zinc finger domain-containing protein [Microbacterium sp.]
MSKSVRQVVLPPVGRSDLGGDVAVDFFNTVSWRLDESRLQEWLQSYLHVLAWMASAELLDDDQTSRLAQLSDEYPDNAAVEHERIVRLRDDTLDALLDGGHPDTLQRELAEAHAAARLIATDDGWRWSVDATSLATPRHLLALQLGRLVTSPAIARFHRCEDRDCGWVFLDTSRQHNRRWCSAADCGNRNRVRAHYARTRPQPS